MYNIVCRSRGGCVWCSVALALPGSAVARCWRCSVAGGSAGCTQQLPGGPSPAPLSAGSWWPAVRQHMRTKAGRGGGGESKKCRYMGHTGQQTTQYIEEWWLQLCGFNRHARTHTHTCSPWLSFTFNIASVSDNLNNGLLTSLGSQSLYSCQCQSDHWQVKIVFDQW